MRDEPPIVSWSGEARPCEGLVSRLTCPHCKNVVAPIRLQNRQKNVIRTFGRIRHNLGVKAATSNLVLV